MTKIVAIIPARGGSKGIPKKNIKNFSGKPLVVHSIEYALSCNLVDEIVVSTDDKNIIDISQKSGAKVIDRPSELASNTATTESVIAHFLETSDTKPDIIVLLQPTSPLRPENSLEKVIQHFQTGYFDSLLSISPTHHFFWKLDGDTTIPDYDFLNRPRRQDMKPEDIPYTENGSVYIFTRDHFEKTGNRLGGKIGYVIFQEEFSLQVDTEMDLLIMEEISKKINF